jgi:hypothetical protein
MTDPSRPNQAQIEEISFLKQRIQELEKSEAERKRLEEVKTLLADIGRVIGSTLDIEEVYQGFSVQVRKLIPFDRLAVDLHRPHEGAVKAAYVFGKEVSGRRKGDVFPLKGSAGEAVMKTRAGLHACSKNLEKLSRRFSDYDTAYKAGMLSLLQTLITTTTSIWPRESGRRLQGRSVLLSCSTTSARQSSHCERAKRKIGLCLKTVLLNPWLLTEKEE